MANATATRQERVDYVASSGHEAWRADRALEKGGFEPRFKTTEDVAWAEAHGTDQVDIANTDYSSLPQDWKGENLVNGELVIDALLEAKANGVPFDTALLEAVADKVHEAWMERNGNWAPPHQMVRYSELPEEEKEKDRLFVRAGMETFK